MSNERDKKLVYVGIDSTGRIRCTSFRDPGEERADWEAAGFKIERMPFREAADRFQNEIIETAMSELECERTVQ